MCCQKKLFQILFERNSKIATHFLFLGRGYEYKIILCLNKKNQKWKIWNFLKANNFISLIVRSSPSEVLKRILVLHVFSNFQEKLSCKVYYHLECFEHLWLAVSEDSNDKILLFSFNELPESNWMLFCKICSPTSMSYQEEDGIDKAKCFKENDKRKFWGDAKLLF